MVDERLGGLLKQYYRSAAVSLAGKSIEDLKPPAGG